MKRTIAAVFILLMALSFATPLAFASDQVVVDSHDGRDHGPQNPTLCNDPQVPFCLPTSAQILGGGGDPSLLPYIEFKWELPDDCWRTPCTQVTPVPGAPMGSGSREENVFIVAGDIYGTKSVEMVFTELYDPNGNFMGQCHARRLCKNDPVDNEIINNAIWDAYCSDHLTMDDVNQIYYELNKEVADMWTCEFTMDSCWPAGFWTLVGYAVDEIGGTSAPYVNTFQYFSLKAMAIDFSEVNFGPIRPGDTKIVPGDEDWSTPDRPTVRNCANDNFWISVKFDNMIGDAHQKIISCFDAEFRGETLHLKGGECEYFSDPLEPCTTLQIDFSIHAPEGLPTDTYQGMVHIGFAGIVPTNAD